jgi:hypothetical protein
MLHCYGDALTDASIIRLGERCPNLCELDMTSSEFTDLGIVKIADGCSNLYTLRIGNCFAITEIRCPH